MDLLLALRIEWVCVCVCVYACTHLTYNSAWHILVLHNSIDGWSHAMQVCAQCQGEMERVIRLAGRRSKLPLRERQWSWFLEDKQNFFECECV